MKPDNEYKLHRSIPSLLEILERQTRTLEQLARPYVIADVYPRWHVNMLYFRVRNVGQTPAFDIRVSLDPPVDFPAGSSAELNIFRQPISALGKGEEISFFFNSAIELFNNEDIPRRFEVALQYRDMQGTQYRELLVLDVDLWRHLALELPASDKLLNDLARIQSELEKLARYTEMLRHQTLSEAYRKSQREAEQPEEGDTTSGG